MTFRGLSRVTNGSDARTAVMYAANSSWFLLSESPREENCPTSCEIRSSLPIATCSRERTALLS